MEPVTFGSPDFEKLPEEKKELANSPAIQNKKTGDLFDALTTGMRADQITFLAKFLKRFVPVVIFIFTCAFGIGVGKTVLVSNCLQGVYGEISLFFGAITIPLYTVPEVCFYPDKAQDFMSIRPLVFLVSFIIVFAIWSYFDRKLQWRDRGNYQAF